MDNFTISGTSRAGAGKGVARKLRVDGLLPAILYGQKKDPMTLSVQEPEVRHILTAHPDSPIVKLHIEEGEVDAIIRDVQRHPATGRLVHIDLQRIRLDEEVRVDVHIQIQGDPVGVKLQGGILEHGTRVLEITCLPADIPESILIDVSGLDIHDSIKLSDIAANYPKVQFMDDLETTLASVQPPAVEKEPAEGEEAEAAAGEVPTVAEEKSKEKDAEESAD